MGAGAGAPTQRPLLSGLLFKRMQVGDRITGGDMYGVVNENSLIEHRIMLPPNARGNVTYIAPAGHYSINEEIIEIDFQGTKKVTTAAE